MGHVGKLRPLFLRSGGSSLIFSGLGWSGSEIKSTRASLFWIHMCDCVLVLGKVRQLCVAYRKNGITISSI